MKLAVWLLLISVECLHSYDYEAATDSNFTTSEELDLSLDYLSSIALNAGTPEEFRPFYKPVNVLEKSEFINEEMLAILEKDIADAVVRASSSVLKKTDFPVLLDSYKSIYNIILVKSRKYQIEKLSSRMTVYDKKALDWIDESKEIEEMFKINVIESAAMAYNMEMSKKYLLNELDRLEKLDDHSLKNRTMDVLDQVQKTIDFIDAHISIEDEILVYRKNLRKLITQTFKGFQQFGGVKSFGRKKLKKIEKIIIRIQIRSSQCSTHPDVIQMFSWFENHTISLTNFEDNYLLVGLNEIELKTDKAIERFESYNRTKLSDELLSSTLLEIENEVTSAINEAKNLTNEIEKNIKGIKLLGIVAGVYTYGNHQLNHDSNNVREFMQFSDYLTYAQTLRTRFDDPIQIRIKAVLEKCLSLTISLLDFVHRLKYMTNFIKSQGKALTTELKVCDQFYKVNVSYTFC